jgi:hypothetical protein
MSTATGTGSVSRWRILAALLIVAGIVCGVVAAATWKDFGIEGVYLNRSVGEPAYSAAFSTEGDLNAPRILLGAAIGLGVAGLLVLGLSLQLSAARRRARPPQAPAADPGP